MSKPYRAWINQPSTSQIMHDRHGENVLAVDEHHGYCTVYSLSGGIVSSLVPSTTLSRGWIDRTPKSIDGELVREALYASHNELVRLYALHHIQCAGKVGEPDIQIINRARGVLLHLAHVLGPKKET